jgi:hypothetical protein
MLDKGIPLTRNAYLMMNWGGDLPADWNHEHEADLPEFFRDPSAVAQMPRPVATKDHRD